MRIVKFLLWSVFILCIGLPAAFVLFVMAMAAFGIVFGLASALMAIMLSVLKVALMVVLPIALLVWIFNRMTSRQRV
ncbi:MAG: hypothetical protein ABIT20_14140 [Gemmatimonadaceae bacterium]